MKTLKRNVLIATCVAILAVSATSVFGQGIPNTPVPPPEVPEPGSLLLASFGAGLLLLLKSRRLGKRD